MKTNFNGADYVPSRDGLRLTKQLKRVFDAVADGKWHTLSSLALATGDPEASISAQLRHLRKPRFGGWTISKEYLGNGLYAYRLELMSK